LSFLTTSQQVRFARNQSADIVFDRAYNTASMLAAYYPGRHPAEFMQRMDWSRDDPNVLTLDMPGWAGRWARGVGQELAVGQELGHQGRVMHG
jgi:hypothetical protein